MKRVGVVVTNLAGSGTQKSVPNRAKILYQNGYDSASMVSEAVASRKPVVTLDPKHHEANKNYCKILEKFEDAQRIKSVGISALNINILHSNLFVLLQRTSIDEIAQKLCKIGGCGK